MVCLQSGSVSAHGVILFFFVCLYILFSETQSGKIKKKERWRIFGGYFAGRFLGDELACGDA